MDAAAANGDLGDRLPPCEEFIKETVAVAIDEQTTGDTDLGEELAGDEAGDDEIPMPDCVANCLV